MPVNAGETDKTRLPDPVDDVTPVQPLATDTIPVTFAALPVVF